MEKVVSFIDYEKISDTMMYLGNNVYLRFNIRLAKKGIDGKRYHFHKEYQYPSNYINQNDIITIKRDFEYYISIENVKEKDLDFFCMITISDILLLRATLNNVSHWLDGTIKTYGIKNGKLVILGKHDNISMPLVTNKILKFEPIVITNINDEQSQGIRLYIDNVATDIPANTFMGFVYLMNTIDMFSSAQIMLNYISGDNFTGRNTISFSNSEQEDFIKTKTGRFPPSTGGSYFKNNLDDM